MAAWCFFSALFVHILSAVQGSKVKQLQYISEFFETKSTSQIQVYLCDEIDSITLWRYGPFSKFLAKISVKRKENWESIKASPVGFFIDFSCDFNKQLFAEVPGSFFTSGYNWLVSGSHEDALGLLEAAPLGLQSEITVLLPNMTLFQVYRIYPGQKLKISQCEDQDGPRCPSKTARFNLEGATLKAAVVNYFHTSNDDEGRRKFDELVRYRGLEYPKELFIHKYYALGRQLAQFYNFNVSLVLGDTFGYKMPNGSYNGLVHLLQTGEADITLTPMALVAERIPIVGYTIDLERVTFIFVFREERTLGGVTALIVPFSAQVWIVIILISIAGIAVSSFIFYIYHPQDVLAQGFLNVIGVVCAQGVLEMNVTSARILNLFMLILGLLLASYYNASIMNGLLSPTPSVIKNVEDILNSRKIALSNISYMNPIFLHPLLKKKLADYKTNPVYEIPEGVRKIKREDYALVGDGSVLYSEMEKQFTNSEKCSTRRVQMSAAYPLSPCCRKNSHFTEMMKIGYAWLRESGISHREKKHWYPDPPHCLGGTVFTPVSVKAISIAFCVYAIGFILSLFILVIEMCVHKITNDSKRPINVLPQGFLP